MDLILYCRILLWLNVYFSMPSYNSYKRGQCVKLISCFSFSYNIHFSDSTEGHTSSMVV
jgi:hypothetical protein